MRHARLVWIAGLSLIMAGTAGAQTVADLGVLADGWSGEIAGTFEQSYVGWDVEIGDADNDGKNEILSTGCPDSQLYLLKKPTGPDTPWRSVCLADNLAEQRPGMGLAVKVVDINRDGVNEVLLGTGEEGGGTAIFYLLQTDGAKLTKRLACRPSDCNKSSFTHNLAPWDLDQDGVLEVISAYCGGGEIVRYDITKDLDRIDARQLHKLSGSGEESLIVDVDNDGAVEFITANGFRDGKARVEIFEFDSKGELVVPPRIAMPGYDGKACFYTSMLVGDVDNDTKNELVVGWKQHQKVNIATLIAYRVDPAGDTPEQACALDYETADLDMGYFEKMMAIADADNDGKNELVVSTRGDNVSEFITSEHLGHIFLYRIQDGKASRQLIMNFDEKKAESSWIAVGDVDNDGKNEIAAATGIGDRTKPGVSYMVVLRHD